MKKNHFENNNYPDCLDQREYLCLILLVGVCVCVWEYVLVRAEMFTGSPRVLQAKLYRLN